MTISLDIETARHIARLARIDVDDDDLANYAKQLSAILDYVEQLQTLDTADVTPMAHALPTFDVFREDEVGQPLSQDDALGNAPDKSPPYFRVPKVLDQEGA